MTVSLREHVPGGGPYISVFSLNVAEAMHCRKELVLAPFKQELLFVLIRHGYVHIPSF